MADSCLYCEYIKLMYQKGYYVERYSINLMSYEVFHKSGRIFIIPEVSENEDLIYIFTGTIQKLKILSEPTEFRLTLYDSEDKEFKDEDHIMLSAIDGDIISNLFTRNYATWKFGTTFDKGISLDSSKFLVFQAQKPIGKFDIDIINIDLFRHKNKIYRKEDRMLWLD